MARSSKSVPDTVQELRDLLVAYGKQETIDPLRNLGRYLGFGLAGIALLTLGTFFLALSALRALQTMTGDVFADWRSFLPYVIVLLALSGVIALAVSRISTSSPGPADTVFDPRKA
ncbi:MAG TPA: phage holin family protein [Acidimicrobiales bacterium]